MKEVKYPSKITKLPSTLTVIRPAPKSQSNQSAETTQAKAKKACSVFFNSVCMLQSCLTIRITWEAFVFFMSH